MWRHDCGGRNYSHSELTVVGQRAAIEIGDLVERGMGALVGVVCAGVYAYAYAYVCGLG